VRSSEADAALELHLRIATPPDTGSQSRVDLHLTDVKRRRQSTRLGVGPRRVNDAWIVLCRLARKLPLATFNKKDLLDFAGYDGLVLMS